VIVFCRPPTTPLCSSGTEETVTAPSWEDKAPMIRAIDSGRNLTPVWIADSPSATDRNSGTAKAYAELTILARSYAVESDS